MKDKLKISLVIVHMLLIIVSIPYGFLTWLLGTIPHVYDDPVYCINLTAVLAYDLSAFTALIFNAKYKTRCKNLLLVPFIFLAIAGAAFVYLLVRYR